MVAIVSGKSVIWKLPASSKRKQFRLLRKTYFISIWSLICVYGDTFYGLTRMLMRKIVNNDVSKDSTMVTRILSDGGDRIWEIRDIKNATFLEKEAVHASF